MKKWKTTEEQDDGDDTVQAVRRLARDVCWILQLPFQSVFYITCILTRAWLPAAELATASFCIPANSPSYQRRLEIEYHLRTGQSISAAMRLKNENGLWDCMYREYPLPEVPAPESHFHATCPSLPAPEPFAGPCTCEIHLNDWNEEYNEQNTFACCEILTSTSNLDGSWNNHWDCSNLLTAAEDGGTSGSTNETTIDDDPRDEFLQGSGTSVVMAMGATLLGIVPTILCLV